MGTLTSTFPSGPWLCIMKALLDDDNVLAGQLSTFLEASDRLQLTADVVWDDRNPMGLERLSWVSG